MASIENKGFVSSAVFIAEIQKMSNGSLVAQQLTQQGAIHATSYLLMHGCTPAAAEKILESLRVNMRHVRDEARRRGICLFEEDQTGFN